jgi:hypothetical protein
MVSEGERKTPQMTAISDDAESSASSVAMEFVMIESTNISSSKTTLDEEPVVIPLDLNKDNIIAEPVKTTTYPPTQIDASTTVQASKELSHRYIIRGGKVIHQTEPPKECVSVPESPVAQQSPDDMAPPPDENELAEPTLRGHAMILEISPQRKANKFKAQTRPATGDSDGWSTDTEMETNVTSEAQNMETNAPEGSTQFVTAVSHPIIIPN